jgi:DNA adenine methylase
VAQTQKGKLRSPILWFGGKGNMVEKLLKLIPKHHIYVEVFGGGAQLLFAKLPSPVEVYNDIDSSLTNFFRVLRDPEKFQRFYRLVSLTPYSREEYYFCRDTWEQCDDDVERAYRWFVVARMSFSGYFGASWGFALNASSRGMSERCSSWLGAIKMLPQIHARVMRVQIEHKDFRELIPLYDTPKTLFYLDPPYIPETRRSGGYQHEMTIDDHKELVNIILKVKGMVMLSGYRHPIYEPLEQSGWVRYDYETACHAAGRTRATGILGKGAAKKIQPRVESVWLSPNCQKQPLLVHMVNPPP